MLGIQKSPKMGIYSNGRIYGISIRSDKDGYTRFEKTFPKEMTTNDIKEFYDIYTMIDTNEMSFYIYTQCSTTYERESNEDMYWMPTTRKFIETLAKDALNSQ